MSMSEIMSNADLTLFPKVALIIFMGVFALVAYRVVRMGRKQNIDALSRLALDDGEVASSEGGAR